MDMFSDIKSVMNDLQQRKVALGQQLKEFNVLQNEINQLVERSSFDPDAMAKLINLKKAFPEGLELQQGRVMNKVNELESHFKVLEQQFTFLDEIELLGIDVNEDELGNTINQEELLKINNNVKTKKVRNYL